MRIIYHTRPANQLEFFMEFLSGMGFDVHALVPTSKENNTIPLCGIAVPCPFEIIAHSDGDVALHALVDAILGAIGAGDIGEHFSPNDSQWRNKNSAHFVSHAMQLCREKNATLVNADIIIICEAPKINNYKKLMRENLAALLLLPIDRVNIKATTTEKLGFLGRKEGIAAQAIVSVKMPARL